MSEGPQTTCQQKDSPPHTNAPKRIHLKSGDERAAMEWQRKCVCVSVCMLVEKLLFCPCCVRMFLVNPFFKRQTGKIIIQIIIIWGEMIRWDNDGDMCQFKLKKWLELWHAAFPIPSIIEYYTLWPHGTFLAAMPALSLRAWENLLLFWGEVTMRGRSELNLSEKWKFGFSRRRRR